MGANGLFMKSSSADPVLPLFPHPHNHPFPCTAADELRWLFHASGGFELMEKNAPKFTFNKKLAAIGGAALVLAASALLLLRPGNIVSELKVEAGRESISANEFRKEDKGIDAQFVSDMTAVDLKTIGQYPVKVQYKNKTYDCTVIVEDTIAPEAEVRNLAKYSYETPAPEDFIVSIKDASPVTVQYEIGRAHV